MNFRPAQPTTVRPTPAQAFMAEIRALVRFLAFSSLVVLPFVYLGMSESDRAVLKVVGVVMAAGYLAFEAELALSRVVGRLRRIAAEEIDACHADADPS